jgi:hypothetical protein
MLYKIAHFLRDKMPFIWDLIDMLNSFLFSVRYGQKLKSVEKIVLPQYAQSTGLQIVRMEDIATNQLTDFFAAQPEDAYTFFKPLGFDEGCLKKLQRNRSFLAYVLMDNGHIAAYCFIRSFFMGKGFRGRMVGMDFRGRGLGTLMNKLMNDIGFGIGLRLFETVSKDNIASYRSALSASKVKVVEELEHNELYLEILKED